MNHAEDFINSTQLAGLHGSPVQNGRDFYIDILDGVWEGHRITRLVTGSGLWLQVTWRLSVDGEVLAESDTLKQTLDKANPSLQDWCREQHGKL